MADEQRTLTIIEHLTELRKRITIALAALVVGVRRGLHLPELGSSTS